MRTDSSGGNHKLIRRIIYLSLALTIFLLLCQPIHINSLAASSTIHSTTSANNSAHTNVGLAYVPMVNNALALIDLYDHTTLDPLDLIQFGCRGPERSRLNPGGSELYIICLDTRNIIVLATSDLSLIATIDDPVTSLSDVTFIRFGAYALASGTGKLDVIDTTTHTIDQQIPLADYEIKGIIAHPYLPRAYVVADSGESVFTQGNILIIDTNDYSSQTIFSDYGYMWSVQIAPDGRSLYASFSDEIEFGYHVLKLDVATNAIVDQIDIRALGMEISPDSSTIYANDGFNVNVIDTATMSLVTSIKVGTTTFESELTCDGSELYVARNTAAIPVIDSKTLTVTFDIPIANVGKRTGISVCPQTFSEIVAHKTVDRMRVPSGQLVNYAITTSNYSFENINGVTITDTLPMSLTYQEGSLNATTGIANYLGGMITWTGDITASTTTTISFGAAVSPLAISGTSITNTAYIRTPTDTYTTSVSIDIPYEVFLPCTVKACMPIIDNFSNPATGWPTGEYLNLAKTDYINGEYQILVKLTNFPFYETKDYYQVDFRLQVDLRPVTHLNGAGGLLFSRNDLGQYRFEIKDGSYALLRIDNGVYNYLINWTQSPAIRHGFQSNHLEVIREGDAIILYANNQWLATMNDGSYHGTRLGMVNYAYSGNFDVRFDNFIVYPDNCSLSTSNVQPLTGNASLDAIWLTPGIELTSLETNP